MVMPEPEPEPSSDPDPESGAESPATPAVHVRPLREADTSWVTGLWAKRMGDADHVDESLLAASLDHREPHLQTFIAEAGGDRVGFGIAGLWSRPQFRDTFRINPEPFVGEPPYALLYQAAVAPAHEGKGVATRLTRTRLVFLQTVAPPADAGSVVAVSWLRDDHVDSSAYLDQWLDRVAVLEDYYRNDRGCPDCDDVCHCCAAIYRKRFTDLAITPPASPTAETVATNR